MGNGLINKQLIMEAWVFLREKNMSIPNETLDFIKDAALEKLNIIEANEKNKVNMNTNSNTITDVASSFLKICPSHKPLYLNRLDWELEAEKRFRKGMKQKQCPICKRWLWKDEL